VIKLATDDRAIAKLKSGVCDKVPEGSTHFWRYLNYLLTQCRIRRGQRLCQKRQTDEQRPTPNTALEHSRAGKKYSRTGHDALAYKDRRPPH